MRSDRLSYCVGLAILASGFSTAHGMGDRARLAKRLGYVVIHHDLVGVFALHKQAIERSGLAQINRGSATRVGKFFLNEMGNGQTVFESGVSTVKLSAACHQNDSARVIARLDNVGERFHEWLVKYQETPKSKQDERTYTKIRRVIRTHVLCGITALKANWQRGIIVEAQGAESSGKEIPLYTFGYIRPDIAVVAQAPRKRATLLSLLVAPDEHVLPQMEGLAAMAARISQCASGHSGDETRGELIQILGLKR